jgi:hypothetical protein
MTDQLRRLTDGQAEDPGLWQKLPPNTIGRKLQTELRKLHEAIQVADELAATPDGPASPPSASRPPAYDPALECCCGHTAHWHGQEIGAPEGSGECEFHGDCGCKRFLLRRPLDGSKAAAPVLTDDDHPILLALRTAVCEELEACGYLDEEGTPLHADGCEWIANEISDKVKLLLGASPVLGDEEHHHDWVWIGSKIGPALMRCEKCSDVRPASDWKCSCGHSLFRHEEDGCLDCEGPCRVLAQGEERDA